MKFTLEIVCPSEYDDDVAEVSFHRKSRQLNRTTNVIVGVIVIEIIGN